MADTKVTDMAEATASTIVVMYAVQSGDKKVTVTANLHDFLTSADYAAARTALGLTALATTTPGTDVAAALAIAAIGASGGLVRGTGATLTTPTLSGIRTMTGAKVTTAAAMGALAIDTAQGFNTKTISTDSTFTFSGTPGTANQWFGMLVTNSDGADPHTLTIPSSFSVARAGAITSVVIPASGKLYLLWNYDGSAYNLFGDPPLVSGTGSFVATSGATATNLTLVTPILGTPQSGNLTDCTADGTNKVGFRGAPQNLQTGNYTTVLDDAGKSIVFSGAAGDSTFTIDSNVNVAFPIGTIIEAMNLDAQTVTIAITTDTLRFLPAGTTGSRTLAQWGRVSIEKITSTSWVISGNSALT
jgi:hypothetical protein